MSNIKADVTSSTEVTLSGSFTGAVTAPSEVGFYWGTSSSSLTNKLPASSVSTTGSDSGTFSVTLSGLAPGTSYVFRAYAVVSGTGQYSAEQGTFQAGSPMVFKTQGATKPAVDKDWLELGSGKDGSQ